MKGFSKEFRRDKIIVWGFFFTIAIILSALAFILINLSSLPPYIPLYNQLPWGTNRLAGTIMVFLPVGMVLIFSFINIIVSSLIYSKSQIFSRMLSATNVILSFLTFLFILRTIELIV
jgi:hypothetical protein